MTPIRNLFRRDLFRSINGVVKAGQLDERSVWQELDEYVITRELDKHLRGFVQPYLGAMDRANDPEVTGRIGVWVSGFFGSGKSHFIKILSYLLSNRSVAVEGQAKRAVDFFKDKILDPLLWADLKRAADADTDVILFNIDSKADAGLGREAILAVFLRVFNEMRGFSGDHPHIAHMERYLAGQGRLNAFREAFERVAGASWEEERDAYEFRHDELVAALAEALEQSEESARRWLDGAEDNFSLTVENFAQWVREYLDSRGPEHRIVFLVDEIGQFIGQDTHLMLSLQTIVENLGTACGGRAWVVVTSQEDIDAVLGEIKGSRANDFSKIQGRFITRLSLSSADVREVIQARLLAKCDEVQEELRTLSTAKADILKNQLSFARSGRTFRSFAGEDDFVNYYPFAPYQFQLVQSIFESIRKAGATGLHLARGERSMLDAFQSAAKQTADQPVGVLVPLYRFYPSIESFLDTVVKKTIDQAADLGSLEPFDIELLRVLFLIRYVDELKGALDNLVTLCIDRIDTDRLVLRRQIEESLQRLERETLIGRNGDEYFFLTNEERDISAEIKNTSVDGDEEVRKLGELIYADVLKDIKKHRFTGNNKDFTLTRLCDRHPYGGRLDNELTVSVITPLADEYNLYTEGRCITESAQDGGRLLIRLDDDESLGRELRAWLKTKKYCDQKNDGTLPHTTLRIIQDRMHENRQRQERLVALLGRLLAEGRYYAAGQALEFKEGSATALMAKALDYLIVNTFSKLNYLKVLASNSSQELQAVLRADDVAQQGLALDGEEGNAAAAKEVREFIRLSALKSQQVVLQDLVKRFSARPYGWPEWDTVLLAARLLVVGEIQLVMDGGVLALGKVHETVTTPARWNRIVVVERRKVDPATVVAARSLGRELFAQMGPEGEDALNRFLRERMEDWQQALSGYKTLADTGQYPGKQTIDDSLKLLGQLLAVKDGAELIDTFLKRKRDLLDLGDDFHDLQHFYDKQRPAWNRLRQALTEFGPNRPGLEKDAKAAAALAELEGILNNPEPYGLIAKAEGLIKTVQGVNDALVAERRSRALERVGERIELLVRDLDAFEADADLRNACLYPLQQLRKRVEAEVSIPSIHLAQEEAAHAFDQARERIEKAQADKLQADKAAREKVAQTKNQPQARNQTKGQGEVREPSLPKIQPKVKTSRVVRPRDLVDGVYLETPEQVAAFLERLRETLDEAVDRGERVEIR